MQGAYALPAIQTRYGTLFGRVEGLPVLHDEDGLYRILEKQGAFRAKKRLRYNVTASPDSRHAGITAEQEQALRANGYVTREEYCLATGLSKMQVRTLQRAGTLDRVHKGYVYCYAESGSRTNRKLIWVREPK